MEAHFAKSPIPCLALRHTNPACTRKCLGGQRDPQHPAKRPWRSSATNNRRGRRHGRQRTLDLQGCFERHASQVEARGGQEASDIDDEVTEVAAPPQKKARQSKKWNPYKNLVLASADESFSAQVKSSNPVGFLWPCPLIAAARVVFTAGVSRRKNPGGQRHQYKGCPGRISCFGAAPNAGSIYFVVSAGCRGRHTQPARVQHTHQTVFFIIKKARVPNHQRQDFTAVVITKQRSCTKQDHTRFFERL